MANVQENVILHYKTFLFLQNMLKLKNSHCPKNLI
jgi:hypothetical protein